MELPTSAEVTEGLVKELLDVLYKYEGAMLLSTAVGALEIVKMRLMLDDLEEYDEEDDDN